MTQKRVAVYLRVSTLDQHPQTQLLGLKQLADRRGLEIAQVYEERITGAKA